jgi:phage terminase large subunit-like protein
VLLLRAPNQSGKTTVCSFVFWKMMARAVVDGRVLCKTKDQSLVIQRKLHEMMPPESLADGCWFDQDRGFRLGGRNGIRCRNGSHADFVTTEQGSIAVAAATLDFVWIDEPTKETIFSECVSRVTATGGLVFTSLTPIGAPLKYLRAAVEDGAVLEFSYGLTVEECPWFTQERINETEAMCLPSQRPQRLYGAWDGVTPDRFYGAWEDSLVLPTDFDLPEGDYWVGLGFDHGEGAQRQTAHLVLIDRSKDVLYAWDEEISTGKTDSARDAVAVVDMLARHSLVPEAVDDARGDTNSAGKAEAGMLVNQLLQQEIAKYLGQWPRVPLRIANAKKGPGSVLTGCALIHRAMARAELRVHPRCTALVEHFRHWKGPRDGGAENKALSHAGDGFRYIVRGQLDTRERRIERIRRS